jgi:hypothetical protein
MNAQTVLRSNGAKAGVLLESLGDTAQAFAKTIEAAAVPVVAVVGDTASAFAKSVEEHAGPLAKSLEESAGLLAEAVETTVESLAVNIEKKTERARDDVMTSMKNFKVGTREGLILGAAVGILAAVWLIRKIDREAAAEKLRAAGTRVGETTQGLADKAGTLTDKAAAVTSLAGERVGQALHQIRGQSNGTIAEAKLRLSDATSPAREIEIRHAPEGDAATSDFDKDTQAAIDEAVEQVERVQEEALEEARALGLSNGMKVVAFDGTDIGRVQEVREVVFVLDRPKGPDLLVPLTEVARIEGTVAYLRIDVGQVSKMGWEKADKS